MGTILMALAFITSGTSWPGVATDGSAIKGEAIAGGNSGAAGGAANRFGGGGGAYATKSGMSYVSGGAVTVSIGAGGLATSGASNGNVGTDTNWNSGTI